LLGLFQGISQERIEDQDRRLANQGVHYSLRNSVLMAIVSGGIVGIIGIVSNVIVGIIYIVYYTLSFGLNYTLSFGQSYILSSGPSIGLVIGVSGALLACLLTGGLATLRHYTIRLLLARSHVLPWHIVHFLDDAAARILLRRVGGGYSFAHRLLLDYFASQDTRASSASSAPQVMQP
jgi:hypothetical protein